MQPGPGFTRQLPEYRPVPVFSKQLSSFLDCTGVSQSASWIPQLPQRNFCPQMNAKLLLLSGAYIARDVLFIHCANVILSCFNLNALITSELEHLLFLHVHVSFTYSFSLLIFYWLVVSVLIFRVTYVYLPYSLAIIKLDINN